MVPVGRHMRAHGCGLRTCKTHGRAVVEEVCGATEGERFVLSEELAHVVQWEVRSASLEPMFSKSLGTEATRVTHSGRALTSRLRRIWPLLRSTSC